MSLNVEEPYKEEEVLYQVQVRLNSRGRERVLKVKVYDCAPPLYIHSWLPANRGQNKACSRSDLNYARFFQSKWSEYFSIGLRFQPQYWHSNYSFWSKVWVLFLSVRPHQLHLPLFWHFLTFTSDGNPDELWRLTSLAETTIYVVHQPQVCYD